MTHLVLTNLLGLRSSAIHVHMSDQPTVYWDYLHVRRILACPLARSRKWTTLRQTAYSHKAERLKEQ